MATLEAAGELSSIPARPDSVSATSASVQSAPAISSPDIVSAVVAPSSVGEEKPKGGKDDESRGSVTPAVAAALDPATRLTQVRSG